MTPPRMKILGTLFPLDRTAGAWSLAGHLVSDGKHVCNVSGRLDGWHFEPAPEQAKPGRKTDDGRRIAVYLAYRVSEHLEESETARRIRVATMVKMGNSESPENQERAVRKSLSDKRLKPLLASVLKDGGGIAYVIAHEGKGHCAFLAERGIPESPGEVFDGLEGLPGWFWKEGMRAADYGTLRIKAKQP